MKRLITVLLLLLATDVASAQRQLVQPTHDHPGAFAIVVDAETYDRITEAVRAYQLAVNTDGLSTYILVDDWQNPDEVRLAIQDLAQNDERLEGIALVGDIPIAMVRGAQHLTSSFKIDETEFARYSLERTTVPTDRFYDDFDLEFRFIGQDEEKPLQFYYELTEDSPQYLDPELYSGRIIVQAEGEEKYDALRDYLTRIAASRAQQPVLDRAFFYTGHGYNSEALNGWEGESLALREQFPQMARPGGMLKTVHFSDRFQTKAAYLAEIQDPQLDLAVFHAHGTTGHQLLTRYRPPRTIEQNIEMARYTLRGRLRTAQRRDQDVAEAQANLAERYDVSDSWFEGAFDDSVTTADTAFEASLDLTIDEISAASPQPFVAVFDQCFNGAFHEASFVAGAYVFGNGRTVAALANSVNVMQDVWPNEHLGLLGQGIRVGSFTLLRPRLEAHVIGDPTFRFANSGSHDWDQILRENSNDVEYWMRRLDDADAEARALAVKLIKRLNPPGAEEIFVDMYMEDSSFIVRMQAMTALASMRTTTFYDLLETSISDPYELIRRTSAHWMGDGARASYLPLLTERIHTDQSSRVSYVSRNAIQKVDFERAVDANAEFIAANPAYSNVEGALERAEFSFGHTARRVRDELIPRILDEEATVSQRVSAMRTFRFYRYREVVPTILDVAQDPTQNEDLRRVAVETVGWYVMREDRTPIVTALQSIVDQADTPDSVRREAVKSLRRMDAGFTNPITL